MSIRIATIEDQDLVLDMAMKFARTSPYAPYVTENKMSALIKAVIEGPQEKGIVLLSNHGMLGGIVAPFIYGDITVATELAWWVEPEFRKSSEGMELLEAFEFWAKKVQCNTITMISLDDQIGQFYEKKGYSLRERAYMKEI